MSNQCVNFFLAFPLLVPMIFEFVPAVGIKMSVRGIAHFSKIIKEQ